MLQLTHPAGEHLAHLLLEARAPEGVAVRLYLQYDDLAMAIDEMFEDDAAYDFDGRVVLVLDAHMSHMLDHKRLEVEQTEQGPQLAVI